MRAIDNRKNATLMKVSRESADALEACNIPENMKMSIHEAMEFVARKALDEFIKEARFMFKESYQ